jgi:hypothetical protein
VDHDTLVLAIELAALAIAIAIGIWRVRRQSTSREYSQRAIARAYDMRRDGQRLSMDHN